MVVNLQNPFLFRTPRCIKGTDAVEGQTIHLDESIQVDGDLLIRNCTIMTDNHLLFVQGGLTMENCEIIATGGPFLSISPDASVAIKDSKFTISGASRAVISASYTKNFWIENSSFVQQQAPAMEDGHTYDLHPVIDAGAGWIRNCTFKDINLEIRAKKIIDSVFENCEHIQCGFSDEENQIDRCIFTDCHSVSVDDGHVTNSTFTRVNTLYLTRATAETCTFRELRCEGGSIIYMEEGELAQCDFENVLLKDDACFCDADGYSWVSHCRFVNCRTDHCENELFRGEETKGVIRKRVVEISIVDEDTCTGLDEICEVGGR